MHRCGIDAEAVEALPRGSDAGGVHVEDVLPLPWRVWSVGGGGGTKKQEDTGAAALHTTRLHASAQQRQERCYEHRNQLHALDA